MRTLDNMGKKQITTRQEMLKLLKNNEMKTSNVKEKKKKGTQKTRQCILVQKGEVSVLDPIVVENGRSKETASICMRSGRRNYGSLPDMDSQQTRDIKNRHGGKLYRREQIN